jgi:hypothetical protein
MRCYSSIIPETREEGQGIESASLVKESALLGILLEIGHQFVTI